MHKTYSQKYHDQHLMSLSPAAQVAHLLDKCVKHLEIAIKAAQENEIEKRYTSSMKVVKIISGLSSILTSQTEEEKKMSDILISYYASLIEGVNQFNVENDIQIAQNMHRSLKEMVACWQQVDALNQIPSPEKKEASLSSPEGASSLDVSVST